MKKYFALLLIAAIVSCKKDTDVHQDTTTVKPDTVTTAKSSNNLYIKEKSLYSKEFIASLEAQPYPGGIKVIDNYVIADNDTIYFPETLKLKTNYKFTGFTNTAFYQLDVTRENLTTLKYSFSLAKNEKPVYEKKGTAHLGGLFFLAGEAGEDEESGEGYISTQYTDEKLEEMFIIKIGEPDDKGVLRATVETAGNDKSIPQEVNAGITLRESK